MKLLVATKKTQGQRSNDFCWCNEGELVRFGFACDGEDVDGPCGCRRSMAGMASKKATTTMEIKDVPITELEFTHLLAKAYVASGFTMLIDNVEEDAADLVKVAAHFEVGDIIEYRGEYFQARTSPEPD